jgi:hypothetical protein
MDITISNVGKQYGTAHITKALDSVSFTVKSGEFIAIMGPSGSGKTSLLNIIAAIDTATQGSVFFGDFELTKASAAELAEFRKNNIGFVFQNYNLLDTLTLEENILLALSLNKQSKKEMLARAKDLQENFGIYELRNKYPHEVSGGEKQRCACARAISNKPALVLADEPTGALDSHSAHILLETFKKMNTEMHTSILMVTHDVFSASYAERLLFLKDGKVVKELFRRDKDRKTFMSEIYDAQF